MKLRGSGTTCGGGAICWRICWWTVVTLVAGAAEAAAGNASEGGSAHVTFVFTSDLHFGIARNSFRGAVNVGADAVGAAMVQAINELPKARLPEDGGLRAGREIGAVDFVTITGDITNRQERLPVRIQSAADSWSQFENVFLRGLTLRDPVGKPAPLFLVPGNHDVSNARGHPNGLWPATDATPMAAIYNRMMEPATPRTRETFDFENDRIRYAKTFGGVRCVFLTVWPDAGARAWLADELKRQPAAMPVLIFVHDPPNVPARHFTNPHGRGDINARDKFENVLSKIYPGGKTDEDSSELAQRELAAFLKLHSNIVGYFHGHANWHEAYTWKGPDKDIALPVFRADSPVKGRASGKDETRLSFHVVVFDRGTNQLTSRECFWNCGAKAVEKSSDFAWGSTTTVSLAHRSGP